MPKGVMTYRLKTTDLGKQFDSSDSLDARFSGAEVRVAYVNV